ncbi:MAG TPA: peptidoglycan DD-metalloendopeptidase family protein, partial [Gammaproteobacteria bacterium]|nr:peptidoglycan DD-metalloendopeptidase family protein [Gammaproteobacteria bacterium]
QAYDKLQAQTSEQSATVAQLLALIEEKNLSLASLHADKEALGSVITQLTIEAQPTFVGDTNKPIRDHQRQLPWPVKGKVLHRFGEVYEADSTWQGILIAAPTGTPVHAIYAGQVVYADWLRGLGLIVIVNHGNDYLSLYAHNQSLYKNVGDQVAANEMIAEVGKSGSVADSGLYFEIRFKGEVQNPASWLRPISL